MEAFTGKIMENEGIVQPAMFDYRRVINLGHIFTWLSFPEKTQGTQAPVALP